MFEMQDGTRLILEENARLLERVDPEKYRELYRLCVGGGRVMAYASGRSGFLLRTYIMRLNHLGHAAFFVGDASTPLVAPDDVFLVVSGSGSTATSHGAAVEADKLGARVAAIVGSRTSPIGRLAEVALELPAPHKRGVASRGESSEQTAGSLFEQAAFLVLETMVQRRFAELGGDPQRALDRHANLEA